MKNDTYIFFWSEEGENGYLSNWYLSDFVEDCFVYSCVEQYVMAQKAKLFNDAEYYTKILKADKQQEYKAYGRAVRNFDGSVWKEHREEVYTRAMYLKFSQNEELKRKLLETGDRMLVEASPYDKIWGIGLSAEEAQNTPEAEWQGLNLCGKCLMHVREEIRKSMLAHSDHSIHKQTVSDVQ